METNSSEVEENMINTENSQTDVLSDNTENVNSENNSEDTVSSSGNLKDGFNPEDITLPENVQNIFTFATGNDNPAFTENINIDNPEKISNNFLTFKINLPPERENIILTEKEKNYFDFETISTENTENTQNEITHDNLSQNFAERLNFGKTLSEEQILSKGIFFNKNLFNDDEDLPPADFENTVKEILKTSKNTNIFEAFKKHVKSYEIT